MKHTNKLFNLTTELYALHGVDVEQALEKLSGFVFSLHAWQGDDVVGFEKTNHTLTGGCQVTGNYPGRARTSDELRQDLDTAISLIPGKQCVCLQGHQVDKVISGVDRNEYTIEHFSDWLTWAKERKIGLDIAPAYYSHPNLNNGMSLAHPDPGIRNFWIQHGHAIRKIGETFGKELGFPCICNQWIPDGFKDIPADRFAPRKRLRDSLDYIFAEKISEKYLLDSVESKLFGIGTESYTVGSHDFYLTYAAKQNVLICLDSGHFHPTESVADKISSICCYQKGRILLHVSRGVRWDSDHVLILNDELLEIGREYVANFSGNNIYITLDYFDASINRIAAWVIGARNLIKSILIALLEPKFAVESETVWDFTGRLASREATKALPWGVVWNDYCMRHDIPLDDEIMSVIKKYEERVLRCR